MPYKDKAKRNESSRRAKQRKRANPAYRRAEKAKDVERKRRAPEEVQAARRARELELEQARDARRTPEGIAKKLAYRRAWHRKQTPEQKRRRSDIERARRIGTTVDVLYRLLDQQNYQCAICRRGLPRGEERFCSNANAEHLDHDHETGRVRGILCGGCNTSIGKLGDNALGLAAALHYVSPPADPDCF